MSGYGLEDTGLERPVEPASPEWALPPQPEPTRPAPPARTINHPAGPPAPGPLQPAGAAAPAVAAARGATAAPAAPAGPVPRAGGQARTKATAAVWFGVLGFFLLPVFGSIAALAMGYSARRDGARATAGIVLGWLGAGFWALVLLATYA